MIGSELPKGWKLVPLKEITSIIRGVSYPKEEAKLHPEENYVHILRGGNIQDGKIVFETDDNVYVNSSLVGEEQFVLKDDVVIVASTGSKKVIGKAATIEEDSRCISFGAFLLLLRTNVIDKRFHSYFFQTQYYRNTISSLAGGININNIKKEHIENLQIPLPPLTEQKQIAEKLDKLFDQIETIKEASHKIPELLKNFRQQVLTYAVTGKLTERWRIENEIGNEFVSIETDNHRDYNYNIPDTWKLLSFSNVVSIESNLVNPNDYKDYPLIAPDNIESMTGRILSKPTVAEIAPKSSKHYFTKDSLVYSKIRPYLSKIAYVDFDGLCSADMYPLKTKLNIFYLYYYMLSSEFLSFATTAGERIVLPKINQKSLNIIPVPVPSLKEQEEIVKRIQILFDILDDVERRYNTLCEKLDKLPQALLCKAFKGELK